MLESQRCMEGREQGKGAGVLLPGGGVLVPNSGHQAWQHLYLPSQLASP